MIDISGKNITAREAIVSGRIILGPKIVKLIKANKIPKGNVLETAKIAGILAAKKTPEIIPHCHPIGVESIKIDFILKPKEIKIIAAVKGRAKTGVEMEALVAVSCAALTIYDMCKMFDKAMIITDIKLLKKSGGTSGIYFNRKTRIKVV